MTAQQLKNSILQLAVQGKLVPQDPSDEPASVLLERIRKEKEALIKAKKIKKEKNPSVIFRGADNTPYEKIGNEVVPLDVPFDIPDSWEWIRFSNLVDYSMGKTPPRKESIYWDNPAFPWVSIADMVSDGNVTVTKECISEYAANNVFKEKISPIGTLIMSFKLTVGKVSILGINAYHNEAIISIFPFVDDRRITTSYLFKVLPLISQTGDTKTAIKGNTLNSDSLDNLLIPLPPLEEQQRIVQKIDELTPVLLAYEKSETESRKLDTVFPGQLKKSILQWAVQGKLVPQDENDEPAEVLLKRIRAEKETLIKAGKIKRDKNESVIFRRDNSHYEKCGSETVCIDEELPFEIPKTWAWVRIKDIFNTSSGTTPMRSVSSYYSSPDYNWVRTTDLNNSILRSCEIKISKKAFDECRLEVIPRDSVCIAMYGGAGTIGKNALIDFDTTINQSVCAIHPNYYCNMKYIQLFIQYYRPFWMDRATGTRKDPNINQVIIKNTLIPIPPVNEQLKIVDLVENISEKISLL